MTTSLLTPSVSVSPTWRRGIVPIGALACAVTGIGSAGALGLGVVLALAGWNTQPAQTRRLASRSLSLAIIGLGAAVPLQRVLQVGAAGGALAAGSVLLCLALGLWLGRAFGVEKTLALLVTSGTAICGGSAIAAVAPSIRAPGHTTTAALGVVFALNAVALFVFPLVGHAVGMSPESFGVWAALAIHDTSSVVGAAMAFDPASLEVATTVKLARAMAIVPLTLGLAAWVRRGKNNDAEDPRPTPRPWFILGFVLCAALFSALPSLAPLGDGLGWLARRVMVGALFLVGASLSRQALRVAGARALALGVSLWVVVSVVTLGAVLAIYA